MNDLADVDAIDAVMRAAAGAPMPIAEIQARVAAMTGRAAPTLEAIEAAFVSKPGRDAAAYLAMVHRWLAKAIQDGEEAASELAKALGDDDDPDWPWLDLSVKAADARTVRDALPEIRKTVLALVIEVVEFRALVAGPPGDDAELTAIAAA